MKVNLVLTFCFMTIFINCRTTADDSIGEIYQEQTNRTIERVVGRAYSVTTCDYGSQIGYTCLECHRALHCYPGNVAILVDCYGLFRYCRDGRCSRFQGSKCTPDTKLTTPPGIEEHFVPDVTTKMTDIQEPIALDSKPSEVSSNDDVASSVKDV